MGLSGRQSGTIPDCLMGGHVVGVSGKHGGAVGMETDCLMEDHVVGVSGRQIGAAGSEIRDDVSNCLLEGIVVGVNGGDPQGSMGNRVVGDSMGSKEQLLPQSNGGAPQGSMGNRVVGDSMGSNLRRFPVGGGQLDQVRHFSWVRKGEREPIKQWTNLFSAPTSSNPKLEFYAPACVEGEPEIHPPAEAVLEGVSMWKNCLVGQFFDKRLPIHVVRTTVDKLWGKHEMPEISTTDNGLYLFRFRDMGARDWVMENGPWYIAGRPIILRVWQPGMEMLNIQLTAMPIWVKFYNIPLEYWTNTCLSYIASAVGKPLHMDSHTENKTRLSFARICIEIDLSSKLPKSARLNLGNGKYTTIRIEYPWVPQNCSHCQVFGHKLSQCHVSKDPPISRSSVPSDTIIAGHGNCDIVKVDSVSKINHVSNLGEERRVGVDSVVDSIGTHQSFVVEESMGVTMHETTNSPVRQTNRFEYLAVSENQEDEVTGDASTKASIVIPTDEIADKASTGIMIPDTAEYSDSSPICDSFKLVKRIDELDFTPKLLPLSKSKLKRLRKQNRGPQQGDGNNVTRPHD